ncbi:hypothetical protein KZ288_27515, partial [Escherichia coli]|uniref:hypothetical protein n=1 Tax=Escherichia coli TaxID=562 RepID=UPI001EDA1157
MTASAPAANSASRFVLVSVTAMGRAPTWRATCIAAKPTLLDAAVMAIQSPLPSPPASTRPPYA